MRDTFRQRFQDFKALGKAIESGDMATASTALDTSTKDIQNDPRIARSGKSDQITKDLAAVGDAIKSGDADAAKKAFATLAYDLKSIRGGHHHHVDNDGDDNSGNVPPPPPTDTIVMPATDGTLNVVA